MKVSELKQLIREEIQNVEKPTYSDKDFKNILNQLLKIAKDSNLGPEAEKLLKVELDKLEEKSKKI
jgi:hypothetical protein